MIYKFIHQSNRMRLLLSVFLLLSSHNLFAASFSCDGALTTAEKQICDTPALSTLDFALGQIYTVAFDTSPTPATLSALKQSQRDWLASTRNDCHDVACVQDRYAKRTDVLLNLIQSQSDVFPAKLAGKSLHTNRNTTPYCATSGESKYFDEFDVNATVSNNVLEGTITGAFDCGRKAWDSDIHGSILKHIALVDYDSGFNKEDVLPALMVVAKGTLYFRALKESHEETYIPQSRNIPLKK